MTFYILALVSIQYQIQYVSGRRHQLHSLAFGRLEPTGGIVFLWLIYQRKISSRFYTKISTRKKNFARCAGWGSALIICRTEPNNWEQFVDLPLAKRASKIPFFGELISRKKYSLGKQSEINQHSRLCSAERQGVHQLLLARHHINLPLSQLDSSVKKSQAQLFERFLSSPQRKRPIKTTSQDLQHLEHHLPLHHSLPFGRLEPTGQFFCG